MKFSNYGFYPIEASGSTTTYFCDLYRGKDSYVDKESYNARYAYGGRNTEGGTSANGRFAHQYFADFTNTTKKHVSARLSCKPLLSVFENHASFNGQGV